MEKVVLDTSSMPWESGLDLIASMAPAFRENLGPEDRLEETYSKSRQKTLFIDHETTRRVDLIEDLPGYADLTTAYHDSVEECFVLDGSCFLTGEGDVYPGYYFWRPPGWVHSAQTSEGFRALLMFEGVSSLDGSGPVSRHIRPEAEAGSNATHQDADRAIGPRGWIRHLDTATVAWQRGPAFARKEGALRGYDLDRVKVKILSKNPETGAQSLLVRLAPGYHQARPGRYAFTQFFFVLSGDVTLGGLRLNEGSFMYRPAGSVEPPMTSGAGALLFMKSDGWLDLELV